MDRSFGKTQLWTPCTKTVVFFFLLVPKLVESGVKLKHGQKSAGLKPKKYCERRKTYISIFSVQYENNVGFFLALKRSLQITLSFRLSSPYVRPFDMGAMCSMSNYCIRSPKQLYWTANLDFYFWIQRSRTIASHKAVKNGLYCRLCTVCCVNANFQSI